MLAVRTGCTVTVQTKRFTWLRTPSAWKTMQAWRQRRSALTQQFRSDTAFVSSAFSDAQINLSTGLASLAAQAAIQRAQEQLQATQSQFTSTRSSVDLLA
jgi:hypothetical protein